MVYVRQTALVLDRERRTPMSYLDGKAIVVTGAGRGIGRAYALLAAREGGSVVVNDVDADVAHSVAAEINGAGGRAIAAVTDISAWTGAESVINACVHEFGSIHGLVNNAGLFSMADGQELDEDHVERLVRTNFIGVAACGSLALRRMIPQGFGSIVNIVSGAHFGIPHMSVYGATKGAVASLTYGWSIEVEGTGVRVNAVSPLARTRMSESTAEFYSRHNLGRIDSAGSPDPEVNAPAVVFLLSDAAAGINGQILRIEGRQLAIVAHPAVREPVLQGDWTVANIEKAFLETLRGNTVPVGMAPLLRAEYLSGASAFWDGRSESESS
jgi:NAD(P)-dependent dehydrogenase (short-subunit alcohol dehydrogenase family)